MNIAKITFNSKEGWINLENKIKEVNPQFLFETAVTYKMQLQSGSILFCELNKLPIDENGFVKHSNEEIFSYEKLTGTLYMKALNGFNAVLNIADNK